jgi:uncharacterized RDD family membrane protein YckC
LLAFGNIDNWIEFLRSPLGRYFLHICLFTLWLFPYCLRDVIGGRGLGKWIMGLKVVDAGDMASTPSVRQLLLRNVTIWISPVGVLSARATTPVHPSPSGVVASALTCMVSPPVGYVLP